MTVRTDKERTLLQQRASRCACAEQGEDGEGSIAALTRGARQPAIDALVARDDPVDLSHALLIGRWLGRGGACREGQCRQFRVNPATFRDQLFFGPVRGTPRARTAGGGLQLLLV